MTKRIVAYELSGIRRIIGTVDQLPTAELPAEIQLDDGKIYELGKKHKHFIQYKEKTNVANTSQVPAETSTVVL
jgi:hypothetical protein